LVVNVNSIIIEVCTVAESCSGAAITASARMPKSDPKHFKMKKDGISTPKFKAIQFLRYHTPYMPTRRRLVGGLVTVSKTDYTGILMVESVVPISTGGREIRKETQGGRKMAPGYHGTVHAMATSLAVAVVPARPACVAQVSRSVPRSKISAPIPNLQRRELASRDRPLSC
jgi:hypothetical protein